jgi:hypothetical protein
MHKTYDEMIGSLLNKNLTPSQSKTLKEYNKVRTVGGIQPYSRYIDIIILRLFIKK